MLKECSFFSVLGTEHEHVVTLCLPEVPVVGMTMSLKHIGRFSNLMPMVTQARVVSVHMKLTLIELQNPEYEIASEIAIGSRGYVAKLSGELVKFDLNAVYEIHILPINEHSVIRGEHESY